MNDIRGEFEHVVISRNVVAFYRGRDRRGDRVDHFLPWALRRMTRTRGTMMRRTMIRIIIKARMTHPRAMKEKLPRIGPRKGGMRMFEVVQSSTCMADDLSFWIELIV